MKSAPFAAAAAALGVIAASAVAQPATPAYHLVKTVPLGAPDRWDYVVFDAPSHRVYVAHGDTVSVVDGRDGHIVGKVEGVPGGTHGIGISMATGKGYTDDGRAGQAVAFDLKTLKIGAHIPAAADADAIAFDPVTGHVFIIEGDPASVTVIDPKTDKAVATISTGGKVEYGVADDRGHLYVNGEAKREIVAIDTRSNAVTAHWPMPDCASPHGLAIDKVHRRLFSSCVNGLMTVVNADTGRVVATAPIGKGTDAAAFDPKRGLAFSSNGADGTVSVIRQTTPDSYANVATIPTAVSGRTMSLDPQSGRLYIAAADTDPAATPGGRPRPRPGSLRLLFLDPAK
ncbi:YncE family protein [Phenylobacterium sp.]|jgi:DNA-binding beta-propeller fold protein YncE|uniref:YncE family protein n=1 Tax=Phenylobacterium sp. TaxID=1871053 RepID=UPI002F414539